MGSLVGEHGGDAGIIGVDVGVVDGGLDVIQKTGGILESQMVVVWSSVEGRIVGEEFSMNQTSFDKIIRLVMGSKHREPLG